MAVTEEELRLILAVKDQMSGVVKKNEKGLTALKQAAKALGLAYAAMRLAKTVLDFARLGTEVERLNTSFRRLTGGAPDEMLDRLREATRGTISDMSLMMNANRAMMLGVTKDAGTLARLTEIAIARGQALGITAQFAMESLVLGLGRMSPKILDNIGILTGGQKTFDDYAASIGKSADALTDEEKRFALVNMILQDNIKLTGDAASSGEKAAAQFTNLKGALALLLAEPYGEFMEDLATRLVNTRQYIERLGQSAPQIVLVTQNLRHMAIAGLITTREFIFLEQELRNLDKLWQSGRISTEEYRDRLMALHPAIEGIIAPTQSWREELADVNVAMREHMDMLAVLPSAYDRAADAVNTLADNLRAMGWKTLQERRMGGTPWQWISVNDIQEAQRLFGLDLAGAQDYLSEMAYMRKDAAAAQDELDRDAIRNAEAHGRELVRARKQSLDELRSTVEGLLQPTAVTDIDMARTRLGTYTDQWDEYIRRVRSAATDAQSAWKHLIPTDILAQGADAIKVWAAETEQAFYAGMIPEAIDWEAFDRAFEQFMREKAGREAMIQEAMKRTGATKADIEFMLGYSGDVVQGASVAMKEIAATKGPIETIKDALPVFKSNLDIAGSAASALGISSGPLDLMKSIVEDVNEKLTQFEDALEKAKRAVEPPVPTEPVTETIPTAIAGGAVGHGATVVFAAGSVVVTGTGGPGATRRDTETGMLAALRAAGMSI